MITSSDSSTRRLENPIASDKEKRMIASCDNQRAVSSSSIVDTVSLDPARAINKVFGDQRTDQSLCVENILEIAHSQSPAQRTSHLEICVTIPDHVTAAILNLPPLSTSLLSVCENSNTTQSCPDLQCSSVAFSQQTDMVTDCAKAATQPSVAVTKDAMLPVLPLSTSPSSNHPSLLPTLDLSVACLPSKNPMKFSSPNCSHRQTVCSSQSQTFFLQDASINTDSVVSVVSVTGDNSVTCTNSTTVDIGNAAYSDCCKSISLHIDCNHHETSSSGGPMLSDSRFSNNYDCFQNHSMSVNEMCTATSIGEQFCRTYKDYSSVLSGRCSKPDDQQNYTRKINSTNVLNENKIISDSMFRSTNLILSKSSVIGRETLLQSDLLNNRRRFSRRQVSSYNQKSKRHTAAEVSNNCLKQALDSSKETIIPTLVSRDTRALLQQSGFGKSRYRRCNMDRKNRSSGLVPRCPNQDNETYHIEVGEESIEKDCLRHCNQDNGLTCPENNVFMDQALEGKWNVTGNDLTSQCVSDVRHVHTQCGGSEEHRFNPALTLTNLSTDLTYTVEQTKTLYSETKPVTTVIANFAVASQSFPMNTCCDLTFSTNQSEQSCEDKSLLRIIEMDREGQCVHLVKCKGIADNCSNLTEISRLAVTSSYKLALNDAKLTNRSHFSSLCVMDRIYSVTSNCSPSGGLKSIFKTTGVRPASAIRRIRRNGLSSLKPTFEETSGSTENNVSVSRYGYRHRSNNKALSANVKSTAVTSLYKKIGNNSRKQANTSPIVSLSRQNITSRKIKRKQSGLTYKMKNLKNLRFLTSSKSFYEKASRRKDFLPAERTKRTFEACGSSKRKHIGSPTHYQNVTDKKISNPTDLSKQHDIHQSLISWSNQGSRHQYRGAVSKAKSDKLNVRLPPSSFERSIHKVFGWIANDANDDSGICSSDESTILIGKSLVNITSPNSMSADEVDDRKYDAGKVRNRSSSGLAHFFKPDSSATIDVNDDNEHCTPSFSENGNASSCLDSLCVISQPINKNKRSSTIQTKGLPFSDHFRTILPSTIRNDKNCCKSSIKNLIAKKFSAIVSAVDTIPNCRLQYAVDTIPNCRLQYAVAESGGRNLNTVNTAPPRPSEGNPTETMRFSFAHKLDIDRCADNNVMRHEYKPADCRKSYVGRSSQNGGKSFRKMLPNSAREICLNDVESCCVVEPKKLTTNFHENGGSLKGNKMPVENSKEVGDDKEESSVDTCQQETARSTTDVVGSKQVEEMTALGQLESGLQVETTAVSLTRTGNTFVFISVTTVNNSANCLSSASSQIASAALNDALRLSTFENTHFAYPICVDGRLNVNACHPCEQSISGIVIENNLPEKNEERNNLNNEFQERKRLPPTPSDDAKVGISDQDTKTCVQLTMLCRRHGDNQHDVDTVTLHDKITANKIVEIGNGHIFSRMQSKCDINESEKRKLFLVKIERQPTSEEVYKNATNSRRINDSIFLNKQKLIINDKIKRCESNVEGEYRSVCNSPVAKHCEDAASRDMCENVHYDSQTDNKNVDRRKRFAEKSVTVFALRDSIISKRSCVGSLGKPDDKMRNTGNRKTATTVTTSSVRPRSTSDIAAEVNPCSIHCRPHSADFIRDLRKIGICSSQSNCDRLEKPIHGHAKIHEWTTCDGVVNMSPVLQLSPPPLPLFGLSPLTLPSIQGKRCGKRVAEIPPHFTRSPPAKRAANQVCLCRPDEDDIRGNSAVRLSAQTLTNPLPLTACGASIDNCFPSLSTTTPTPPLTKTRSNRVNGSKTKKKRMISGCNVKNDHFNFTEVKHQPSDARSSDTSIRFGAFSQPFTPTNDWLFTKQSKTLPDKTKDNPYDLSTKISTTYHHHQKDRKSQRSVLSVPCPSSTAKNHPCSSSTINPQYDVSMQMMEAELRKHLHRYYARCLAEDVNVQSLAGLSHLPRSLTSGRTSFLDVDSSAQHQYFLASQRWHPFAYTPCPLLAFPPDFSAATAAAIFCDNHLRMPFPWDSCRAFNPWCFPTLPPPQPTPLDFSNSTSTISSVSKIE